KLNWTALINLTLSLAKLFGAVVLVWLRPHPTALDWGVLYLSSTLVVALAAILLVCWNLGLPRLGFSRARTEIREGLYFATSQMAQTVYNDIDKTMLARLSTLEAAGIYGAAYRIIDVSFVPVSALLWSSYPGFFRAGTDGVSAALRHALPLLRRALAYAAAV